MQIEGKRGPGRHGGHLQGDCVVSENSSRLTLVNRDVWRSNVRSVMRAASQLPGGEPTDVDDAPAPAH